MGIYRKIEEFLLWCINRIWVFFITIHEYKNIFKKRGLIKKVVLTREQKDRIDSFYKENYGKKIPYWWHRLYQSYTGNFDYRYIPEYIFSTKIEPKNNKRLDVLPLENKNMLPVLFSCSGGGYSFGVKIPKTYVMCVKGNYFDCERNIISKDTAIEQLKHMNGGNYKAVIKGTVDTSSGRDVRMLDIVNGIDVITGEKIDEILPQMGKDFVVQERIIPHSSFSALYDKAINTLRVVTYIIGDRIEMAPISLRIGQGGGVVDNAHAGGMFIGVTDDGKLEKEAFTEYQKRYTVHPDTDITFEGYQLPRIPDIRQTAVKLHQQIPMVRFVSWDFTLDEDENIVLIEANLHSQSVWLSQTAHGRSFFGENTAEILASIRRR